MSYDNNQAFGTIIVESAMGPQKTISPFSILFRRS